MKKIIVKGGVNQQQLKTINSFYTDNARDIHNTIEIPEIEYQYFELWGENANGTWEILSKQVINHLSTLKISLYPTIVQNTITLKMQNHDIKTIHIYDINGRFIRKINIHHNNPSFSIDDSELKPGNYLIIAEAGMKKHTLRFIKI